MFTLQKWTCVNSSKYVHGVVQDRTSARQNRRRCGRKERNVERTVHRGEQSTCRGEGGLRPSSLKTLLAAASHPRSAQRTFKHLSNGTVLPLSTESATIFFFSTIGVRTNPFTFKRVGDVIALVCNQQTPVRCRAGGHAVARCLSTEEGDVKGARRLWGGVPVAEQRGGGEGA